MASEPVLSREVGNRTSRVSQPVIVISAMVFGLLCLLLVRYVCLQLRECCQLIKGKKIEIKERMGRE